MDGLTGNPSRAIEGMLDSLDSALALLAGLDYPRLETVTELSARLKQFGRQQFDFFSAGFTGTPEYALEHSRAYPPSAVLARIVRQVGEDAEIILRAAEQRRIPNLRAALDLADRLAYRALLAARPVLRDPSSTAETVEDYTVLTYFQKSAEIRVLPYAPIALIGIPMTVLNEPRDFLAIPHELGHFVYFNRRINHAVETANRHYADSNAFDSWQEETFADVLGSLVAGPVMAYDFQELAKNYGRLQFAAADGHGHPPPFLRPLIYTQTLRLNDKAKWGKLADALDESWTAYVLGRWRDSFPETNAKNIKDFYAAVARVKPQDKERKKFARTLAETRKYVDVVGRRLALKKPLEELVALAYDKLVGTRPEDWSGKPAEMLRALGKREGDLDRWFKARLRNPLPAPPELKPISPEKIWDDWVEQEELLQGKTLRWQIADAPALPLQIGVGKDPSHLGNQMHNPLPARGKRSDLTWQLLWLASGWVTDPAEPPGHPP